MTEKFKQIIKENVDKLPKEAQEAIAGVNWVEITEEIGKKYSLDEGQINDFQSETLLVLIGVVDSEFYETNIENQVHVIKETAEKMATEAFDRIFDPIKNLMTENIKKNVASKNIGWQQNVDFILSGGSYLSFINPQGQTSESGVGRTDTLIGKRSMQDIKDKLVN